MNRKTLGPLIGVLFAAILGTGIFFEPDEPMALKVYLATVLQGGLIGLMLGAVLSKSTNWLRTVVGSAIMGGLMGVTISLAKGLEDAPFAVPFNVVQGLVIAAILKRWGAER